MIVHPLAPESRHAAAAVAGRRLSFALTPRALLLLVAGVLFLAPAFFAPRLFWATAVWDVLVLLAALVDGLRLPAPALIEAKRSWLSAPAQGNETEVEISLVQRSEARLRVSAIDDLAPALLESPQPLLLEAYPHIAVKARYRFSARQRGDHTAGKLFLRYRSRIGLAERWAVADLTQIVRVYPRAFAAERESTLFLAPVRQFQLELRRQKNRGQGRDFQSLREYRDGDEMRSVYWPAVARLGSLISKQFQIERSQPVWLVMDTGRLLQARVGPFSKLDYAATAALAMGRLGLLSGDRVGLLAYGREMQQRVLPGKGASHLRQLMESLAVVRSESGEADHLRAAVTLNRMQPRRSLILWLTDLAETAMRPEVIDGAALLMPRHLVLFVAIAQKDLAQVADSRPKNVAAMFERAAAQELVDRRELLLARLRGQGALTLETTPEKMTAAVLNRYLEIKDRALI